MNTVIRLVIALFLMQSTLIAQNDINTYKYVVIPKQFDFQSEDDQYQLNSLTKFLFNKYGFTAFFEDEDLPLDLSQDRCTSLKVDLKKLKGFLITRLQFELLDCNNNIVSTSKVGETKVKQYDTAYNLALREAFETYQYIGYSYTPGPETVVSKSTPKTSEEVVTASKNLNQSTAAEAEIERLKQEVKTLKEASKNEIVVAPVSKPKQESEVKTKTVEKTEKAIDNSWYANPIDNGFQVLDGDKKAIMTLLYSGAPDVYIVKDSNAIVFKKDDYWVYSSNDGTSLKVNRIDLKF